MSRSGWSEDGILLSMRWTGIAARFVSSRGGEIPWGFCSRFFDIVIQSRRYWGKRLLVGVGSGNRGTLKFPDMTVPRRSSTLGAIFCFGLKPFGALYGDICRENGFRFLLVAALLQDYFGCFAAAAHDVEAVGGVGYSQAVDGEVFGGCLVGNFYLFS